MDKSAWQSRSYGTDYKLKERVLIVVNLNLVKQRDNFKLTGSTHNYSATDPLKKNRET